MSRLIQLARAIARYEGFFVTPAEATARGIKYPTIPQRLNNPGDLMFAGQKGAKPFAVIGADKVTRNYAKFETEGMGWAALYAQIQLDASRGETLSQFIRKYAPSDDANDPKSYCAFVCHQLGANGTDLLSQVIAEVAA